MPHRRAFLLQAGDLALRAGVTFLALVGVARLRPSLLPPAAARRGLGIVRPPGSLEESRFLAQCLRCRRCSDSCEAQCIQYFGPEAGSLAGTPYILTEHKGCTLCMECGRTCPSGAIAPLQRKEEARMGVAVVDERLCVTYARIGKGSVCTVCHTVCPLRDRAITLQEGHPQTHSNSCVGCGLCEASCVVKDRRAIQVRTARKWPLYGDQES